MIKEMVLADKLRTVEVVTNLIKADGGRFSCHEYIEDVLERTLTEKCEKFGPNAAPVETPFKAAVVNAPSTNLQPIKKVEDLIFFH